MCHLDVNQHVNMKARAYGLLLLLHLVCFSLHFFFVNVVHSSHLTHLHFVIVAEKPAKHKHHFMPKTKQQKKAQK